VEAVIDKSIRCYCVERISNNVNERIKRTHLGHDVGQALFHLLSHINHFPPQSSNDAGQTLLERHKLRGQRSRDEGQSGEPVVETCGGGIGEGGERGREGEEVGEEVIQILPAGSVS
jgi:hypothetical protein